MGFPTLVVRAATYYKRHGIGATLQRASLAARRALSSNRQVVFYCDLVSDSLPQEPLSAFLKVERKGTFSELSSGDLDEMISFWNPRLARRNIEERLARGASLWLIKSGERLAGYGWTLQGRTIAPHYFPLGRDDFHLFDFHVFPQHRGQGINPSLVKCILRSLAAECSGRAFIEAAEWNRAQLSSLAKTSFRRLGEVKMLTILGRQFVWWKKGEHEKVHQILDRKLSPDTSRSSELATSQVHERS